MVWTDVGGLASGATLPVDSDGYLPTRILPQKKSRFGFSRVISNSVSATFGSVLNTGTGQTINQSGGNLVITSGTTSFAESIIRSAFNINDSFTLRWSTVLSQRIAQQNFILELVDVIGDSLVHNINSTTQVTITIPGNPFTAENVGQKMSWFPLTGAGTKLTMEGTIASVSGNDVVLNFGSSVGVGSGSGTCTLFGWNYHRFLYDSTSATTMKWQTQRNGWPEVQVAATINTTASPGHVGIYNNEDAVAYFADQLRASATTSAAVTPRASGVQGLPDDDVVLYLQIRTPNGTSPASTTTWTINFIDYESYVAQQVSQVSTRPQSHNSASPVAITYAPATVVTQAARPTTYSLTTTASTNAALISSSTTRNLIDIVASNPTATPAFVKLYVKTSTPTVGTDVPVIIIPVPANSTVQQAYPYGRAFSGLGIAVTGAIGSLDTTNAPAGVLISAGYF